MSMTDTERLDWLSRQGDLALYADPGCTTITLYDQMVGESEQECGVREAIDMAMKENP